MFSKAQQKYGKEMAGSKDEPSAERTATKESKAGGRGGFGQQEGP
jgi:protoporphyrinogen oxidase